MHSLIGDVTRESINLVYKEMCRQKNRKKIDKIVDIVGSIALKKVQPFFYSIMAILVLLFVMNCFQFYYYMRYIISSSKQYGLALLETTYD